MLFTGRAPVASGFMVAWGGAHGGSGGPMVGRDRELARVMLLLDALAGSGRLVLAWGRVADGGSLPPYGLWRLVLDEPAVRAADDDPSGASLVPRLW
jgi:hypothetical protein